MQPQEDSYDNELDAFDDSTSRPLSSGNGNDSPFSPSDDNDMTTGKRLPLDHPIFDSDIDPHEAYDEGMEGAAELENR